jgi:hypothetical protein
MSQVDLPKSGCWQRLLRFSVYLDPTFVSHPKKKSGFSASA